MLPHFILAACYLASAISLPSSRTPFTSIASMACARNTAEKVPLATLLRRLRSFSPVTPLRFRAGVPPAADALALIP